MLMPQFFNQATLSYNAGSTTSNVTVGELLETLSATKSALPATYAAGDTVTYTVSIVNTGSTPFNGLTIDDDLGAFTEGTQTLVPLDYLPDSARLYVNGVLQTAPAVDTTNGLSFTGISVPAGSSALLIYQADANDFAPLDAASTITNTATVSGAGLTTPLTADAVITTTSTPRLTISKALSPATVTENGQVTYTFIIQNAGSTAADAADNLSITDTFNPVLSNLVVTLDGATVTAPTTYTYDTGSGLFTTVPGAITVPAATYTRNPDTGRVTINPGTTTLTVTGTI